MKRQATIKRISKETEIELTLKLDGTRNYTIDTGVGFLNHMLELLAFHGELDLQILCKGDLKVDPHHSIEDIGIVLGQALSQALGDKKGIVRYATNYLPMDESISRTSLDLCGRFYHIFKANFKGQYVGDFPLEMLEHFFHSLSFQGAMTLHQELLYGNNDHHCVESLFKGFARSLKQATRIIDNQIISSTGIS